MKRYLITAVLFVLAWPAFAQPYIAANFGYSTTDLRRHDAVGSSSTFAAGYAFTPHLVGELSYLDSNGRTDVRETTLFWKSRGYGIAVIGTLPMGRWSMLGKIGTYRLKTSVRELVTNSIGTVLDETVTRSHWSPSIGVGAQFGIADNVSVRAIFERVDGNGELNSLLLLTVGAMLHF